MAENEDKFLMHDVKILLQQPDTPLMQDREGMMSSALNENVTE